MITVDYQRPAISQDSDSFHTGFSSTKLVAKLGEELQGLYGDVTGAGQPSDLLALARRIDEQRNIHEGEG
ncbi:hypothetical protein [Methylobacterium sp. Leaf466]|uniref:hypothetical protein n=1 Tax=Methylobacterium sp. Leaf466 TaxID=1736386 RepID=UPI0006F93834|nr:hypothetical protein [Methylobacterium sp. Leaf466]KQT78740.1 hypothetical protein ASG59_06000 [Methylobacterium sp. Leaf466]